MRQLWTASLGTEQSLDAEWWYFWDELAAVIAVEPSVATIAERTVAIDDSGATVEREDGATVSVASAADQHRFEQVLLETFAGGSLPDVEWSDDEQRYLEAVRSGTDRLAAAVDDAFGRIVEQADAVPADRLVEQMLADVFDGAAALQTALSDVDVPRALRPEHDTLIGAVASFLDTEQDATETLSGVVPSEAVGSDAFFEVLLAATDAAGLDQEFASVEAACRELALSAFRLGALEDACLIE